ncbi:MAG TPA: hypothetical protein VFB13_02045 [Reyranella sp.]|jgi:hypothetical protein|nr:hypothetical protein [Reyranella sp.]
MQRAALSATALLAPVLLALALLALARPATAGPPFVSDDPEPTDYRHFEIYAFHLGTVTRTGTAGQAGIDFNYGALPDLQTTIVLPAGFARPVDGDVQLGLGNIQFAAKYRFLHQQSFGLDVSFFPRLLMPAGTSPVGASTAAFLLPLWLERDWGKWSLFGGGGCTLNTGAGFDFCQAGAVLNRQVAQHLQLGVELAYQSANAEGTPASTALGLGARYDLGEHAHLLAYINRGIQNVEQTDEFSWYAAMLFTF